MMFFWKMKKTRMVGRLAMTSEAIRTFWGIWADNDAIPTLIDILSVSGSTSSGQTKSFHTVTTDRIDTTPMIGRETGSTIDHRMRNGDAPSISAASSSSFG